MTIRGQVEKDLINPLAHALELLRARCEETERRGEREMMTLKMTKIREQVHEAVSDEAARACINQHARNIHTLYVLPNGRVYWSEEASTNSWDVLAGTVDPVAVIYQTGMGSCACNCDACIAGDDPTAWAGDDASELLPELIARVDAINNNYFDDEQDGIRAGYVARGTSE